MVINYESVMQWHRCIRMNTISEAHIPTFKESTHMRTQAFVCVQNTQTSSPMRLNMLTCRLHTQTGTASLVVEAFTFQVRAYVTAFSHM